MEHSKTKLTVERLYKIAEILEVEVGELLDIIPKNQFNQTNKGNATGYLQQIENFQQENKEQSKKILELYEKIIEEKNILIEGLRAKQKKI